MPRSWPESIGASLRTTLVWPWHFLHALPLSPWGARGPSRRGVGQRQGTSCISGPWERSGSGVCSGPGPGSREEKNLHLPEALDTALGDLKDKSQLSRPRNILLSTREARVVPTGGAGDQRLRGRHGRAGLRSWSCLPPPATGTSSARHHSHKLCRDKAKVGGLFLQRS